MIITSLWQDFYVPFLGFYHTSIPSQHRKDVVAVLFCQCSPMISLDLTAWFIFERLGSVVSSLSFIITFDNTCWRRVGLVTSPGPLNCTFLCTCRTKQTGSDFTGHNSKLKVKPGVHFPVCVIYILKIVTCSNMIKEAVSCTSRINEIRTLPRAKSCCVKSDWEILKVKFLIRYFEIKIKFVIVNWSQRKFKYCVNLLHQSRRYFVGVAQQCDLLIKIISWSAGHGLSPFPWKRSVWQNPNQGSNQDVPIHLNT